jgi:hypothetical protein
VEKHREEETSGGKQDRLQAQQLLDLASKHCLVQEVERPTHSIEVLDLVFTNNCELVNNIVLEAWPAFTDHKLVVVSTTYQLLPTYSDHEQQHLCETGRRFSTLNFNKAPWNEISEELANIDWNNMEDLAKTDTAAALGLFHSKLLEVLERLVPAKKKRHKPRYKMHRMRRLIWKRLCKIRKAIKSSSSISKLSELLQKMWELESQLSSDYTAANDREEDEAVLRIRENPKAFFSFARSRQKTRAKVGPFLDQDGRPNSSPGFADEALRQQYNSVFAQPRPVWTVGDFKDHFKVTEENMNSLNDLKFGPADIEKACSQLNSSSAAGPDGIPAILLKTCRKQLSQPIFHLWRSSLDSGCIPPELLLVLISPIHKGGSRAAPKNYRPVALTSHLIKVFERVVRQALVNHIENLGLIPNGQHGSCARRSTLTQLLSHWDNILEGAGAGRRSGLCLLRLFKSL